MLNMTSTIQILFKNKIKVENVHSQFKSHKTNQLVDFNETCMRVY